ncbi:bis(5'-nucleosyl)-tetraphosphatase [Thiobacillus denitrificans]|uniref:bis(5'-nucleosyl)-tetraphosphatase n=1 Tax=Thiobacillus denitrificans TaxID=36861 RepID=UPI00236834B2|nr:bis(5'-nucleosyl)-tetraphosphatase [Thiobacillus denitrificans]
MPFHPSNSVSGLRAGGRRIARCLIIPSGPLQLSGQRGRCARRTSRHGAGRSRPVFQSDQFRSSKISDTNPPLPAAPKPRTLSAGVVAVRREAGGWRLLVLRAYRNWDFPKGVVEAGEPPHDAAIRETAEETGIDDLVFAWGDDFRETAPYGQGKIARYYLAETQQTQITLPVSPELGRPEHDEWRWVDFDTAQDLLPPRLAPILTWARERLAAEDGIAR